SGCGEPQYAFAQTRRLGDDTGRARGRRPAVARGNEQVAGAVDDDASRAPYPCPVRIPGLVDPHVVQLSARGHPGNPSVPSGLVAVRAESRVDLAVHYR